MKCTLWVVKGILVLETAKHFSFAFTMTLRANSFHSFRGIDPAFGQYTKYEMRTQPNVSRRQSSKWHLKYDSVLSAFTTEPTSGLSNSEAKCEIWTACEPTSPIFTLEDHFNQFIFISFLWDSMRSQCLSQVLSQSDRPGTRRRIRYDVRIQAVLNQCWVINLRQSSKWFNQFPYQFEWFYERTSRDKSLYLYSAKGGNRLKITILWNSM